LYSFNFLTLKKLITMHDAQQVYAFQKSKFLMQKIGFFIFIAAIVMSCKKDLPIADLSSSGAVTNTLGQIAKTNGLMNGGGTVDGGGQPSGVNAITGLSTKLDQFFRKDASGNYTVPTNYYSGDFYGQVFFVTINTYKIYPAPVLGTPVQATLQWLWGSDAYQPNSVINAGSGGESDLNTGLFAMSYNIWYPATNYGGSNPSSNSLLIDDPNMAYLKTLALTGVKMFNPNFLTSSPGGGFKTVTDVGKIICTGDGGFAFVESNWAGSAVIAPNTTGVGSQTVNNYTVSAFAIISNPQVASSGPVSQVLVRDANHNNVQVRMFSMVYSGDSNDDGFHMVGSVTLYNGQVLNVDSWIYP
jgi:hypothetical protein